MNTIEISSLHPYCDQNTDKGEMSPNEFNHIEIYKRNISCFSLYASEQNKDNFQMPGSFDEWPFPPFEVQNHMQNYSIFEIDQVKKDQIIDSVPKLEDYIMDEEVLSNTKSIHNNQQVASTSSSITSMKKFIVSQSTSGKSIQKSQDYDKNICRYLARLVVRQFCNKEEYKDDVIRVGRCDEDDYKKASTFFLDNIETFTGHRAFADYLLISHSDSQEMKRFQTIFQRFTKWFLRERAIRYILKGEAQDKLSYIRYKNDIMLYYIEQPERWQSNRCMKQKRLVRKY